MTEVKNNNNNNNNNNKNNSSNNNNNSNNNNWYDAQVNFSSIFNYDILIKTHTLGAWWKINCSYPHYQ